jgi:hypothetical protein
MSLKQSHVRWNVAESAFHYKIPTIQVHRHLTTTWRLLLCPAWPQKWRCVIARWIALLTTEDGGCNLIVMKVTYPNIMKVASKSPPIYSPTELEWLYRRLRAKNKCVVQVTNQTSLIHLGTKRNHDVKKTITHGYCEQCLGRWLCRFLRRCVHVYVLWYSPPSL